MVDPTSDAGGMLNVNDFIKKALARDAVDGVLGVYLYQYVMGKFRTGRETSS